MHHARSFVAIALFAVVLAGCVTTPAVPVVGLVVTDDPTGAFRFPKFLQDLEAAGDIDLVEYDSLPEFGTAATAGTAPGFMFIVISSGYLGIGEWAAIEPYLVDGGSAVIMTYCIYDQAISTAWGLGDLADHSCYSSADEVTFVLDEAATGVTEPIDLTMPGYVWGYAVTSTGVEGDVTTFCALEGDPTAICGVLHRTYDAALALWLPEAMVAGPDDTAFFAIQDLLD